MIAHVLQNSSYFTKQTITTIQDRLVKIEQYLLQLFAFVQLNLIYLAKPYSIPEYVKKVIRFIK